MLPKDSLHFTYHTNIYIFFDIYLNLDTSHIQFHLNTKSRPCKTNVLTNRYFNGIFRKNNKANRFCTDCTGTAKIWSSKEF